MPVRYRTLVLVRHGEYSPEGLTRRGRMQAAHTARRIARLPVTTIHCSTMRRAVETAQIISGRLRGLSPRRARLLRECFPSMPRERRFEGLTSEMIKRGKHQADRAYRRYFRRAAGRDVCDVLVCHGNLIRYLVCRALGLGKYAWLGFGTTHCGISVVRITSGGDFYLESYNDTGHLPGKLRTR